MVVSKEAEITKKQSFVSSYHPQFTPFPQLPFLFSIQTNTMAEATGNHHQNRPGA